MLKGIPTLKSNIASALENPANRTALSNGIKGKAGGAFQINGRTYRITYAGSPPKRMIQDINLTDSITPVTELTSTMKAIKVEKGVIRPVSTRQAMVDAANAKWKSYGLNDDMARTKATNEVARMEQSTANQIATRMDRANTLATSRTRTAGSAASRNTPEAAALRRDLSSKTYSTIDDVTRDIPGIQRQASQARSAGLTPKELPVKPATAANDIQSVIKKADDAVSSGRTNQRTKEVIGRIGQVLVIGIVAALVGLFATGKFGGQQSARTVEGSPQGASAAAAAAVATSQTATQEAEAFLQDYIEVAFLQAAIEHQKFLNGCFLYDSILGTLTKIKVLSCNGVDTTNAMDTCSLSGRYTSAQDVVNACPGNTFIPCLDPLCTKVLYNAPTAPTVVAGTTSVNACAGIEYDDFCSSYCRADAFDLPEHQELMCVNLSVEAAYIDLMSALGYNVEEMFPTGPRTNSPSSKRWLWVLIAAVAVSVLVGGAVVYKRRKNRLPVK